MTTEKRILSYEITVEGNVATVNKNAVGEFTAFEILGLIELLRDSTIRNNLTHHFGEALDATKPQEGGKEV